jgi:Co/Zn/Cd efflux system component
MTRSRIIVVNLMSWTLGVIALWLGNLALRRFVSPGVFRYVLYFALLGLVVTVFGGTYGLLRSRTNKNSGSGL